VERNEQILGCIRFEPSELAEMLEVLEGIRETPAMQEFEDNIDGLSRRYAAFSEVMSMAQDVKERYSKYVPPVTDDWDIPNVEIPEEQPRTRKFQLMTGDDVDNLPDQDYLVEKYIADGTINGVYGMPGERKSFLVLSMFFHMACNEPWLGHAVKEAFVIYTAGEGMQGYKRRLRALRSHHHEFDMDLFRKNFRMVADSVQLGHAGDLQQYIEDIKEQIPNPRPAVVGLALDTLFQCAEGEDINSPAGMSKLMGGVKKILKQTGVNFIIVVHHKSVKEGARGAMGSSVFTGNLDGIFQVSLDHETDVLTVAAEKVKDDELFTEQFKTVRVSYGDGPRDHSLVVVPCSEEEMEQQQAKTRAKHDPKPKRVTLVDKLVALVPPQGITRSAWNDAWVGQGENPNSFSGTLSRHGSEHVISIGDKWFRKVDPNKDTCWECGGSSWASYGPTGVYICNTCCPDMDWVKDSRKRAG
jgi:hypothetical protein